ncbi:hypothetical protein PSACC_02949, partial [Paramicrosporidium saccamoebae]
MSEVPAPGGGGMVDSASSSSSSSSRISIRIPRKVVSGEVSGLQSLAESTSSESLSRTGDNREGVDKTEKEEESANEGAEESANDNKKGEKDDEGNSGEESRKKSKKLKPPRGRKRRGQDDSEESAYSEASDDEDEETESEEVYSDEESDETVDEDEDNDEEWDNSRKKYVRKESFGAYSGPRNYNPPMSIPFQYASMGYGPIQPLPPSMANIPMFANLKPATAPGTGIAAGSAAGAGPVTDGTGSVDGAAAGSTSVPSESAAPKPVTPQLTPAQLQELAKSTISMLANATQDGKPLIPRAADGTAAAPTSELKETLTTILASPQWRAALLQKLQMNRAVSAEQAARLGLRPAAPMPIAPLQYGVPMMRPLMRPMPVNHYHQPRPKPPKKKKRASPAVDVDEVPIASRRERRSARQAVDYSKFFNEGAEDDEESPSEEEEGDGEERVPKAPRIRRVVRSRQDSEDEHDEDDERVMRSSRTSDDVGVEKILAHRIVNGNDEFLVKFHNLSYIHTEWIGREEMMQESSGSNRIKRFLSKPLSERHYLENHPFNPEYTQIERIVHGWDHPDEHDPSIQSSSYLVKWVNLPYSEATWEKKASVLELPEGEDRLKEFSSRPTLEQRRTKTVPAGWRPDRSEYQNMTESPIYKGENSLRPYQLEGVNWLVYCWTNRQSCIIADEMDLNVIVYHGNIPSRDVMSEYEFHYKTSDDKPVPNFWKFDVMITTYEMALAGFEHLQPIVWRAAIFDEAHRLKNRMSKATETLKALQIEHKVLLTGTPLQNNIEELWSLLNFLQPHRFFSESQFKVEYGNLQRSEDVIKLQELLKPLMLRRLKEDVEKSIPVKEETVVEVELTSLQKRYYRAILERNFAFLTKGCRGTNAPNLINAMMELRKCCIHPYLIKGAEDRIVAECAANSPEEQMHCMVQASGKLVLVDKLLRRLRENGHKVLIFSQMTRCLDLLTDYLRWREYPFERIDGAIKGESRQAAIDRFGNPEIDSFVFLLCTRAGGVGINLTAADTVVIFDSDWNPQNDIQAQARCHRIGQTKSVKVYRLLTRNTYEREMFDKAGLKLGLDQAVLRKILPDETLEGATHNPQLSKKEVETLLKKGAYGLLMENDEDSIKFCEEDIDQILARRTTVIRHEGGKAQTAEGGSIFSKASFAATADDMDIDIDDPNFWELWARRLDLDPRQLLSSSGVVVDEPRIKRQARRLRAEDLALAEMERTLNDTIANSMDESGTAGEPQIWTSGERARFIMELARIGIHRQEEMVAKFPGRGKNDLIACARAVIKVCLEAVEASDDTRLREDNEKLLLAHLDFDRSAVDEVVDDQTGNIDMAAAEMQNDDLAEPTVPQSREFSKADIPFSGASRRQIFEFRSFLREAPSELLDMLKANAKSILLRLQLLDFIRQLVEGHATVAKKTRKGAADEMEYHLPVPNVAGSAPVKGWGKNEDETMVVEIYKHGFGRYDKVREAISEEYTSDEAWPTESVLEDRLKKVVLAMEKRTQAAAKLAIQAMNANEGGRRRTNTYGDDDDEMYEEEYTADRRQSRGGGATKKKPAQLNTRWSKRDRGEFQRVVMAYGLPLEKSHGRRDWSTFKELGSFANTIMKADDRAFDEYCDMFVKGCKAVADKRTTRGRRQEEPEPAEDNDDEAYEDTTGNAAGSKGPLPLIPVERAKKALARIEVLNKLRLQVLTLDKLETFFERSRRTSGLPMWWQTPAHDIALLRAVGKYGFGRWDLVVMDEKLSFRSIYESSHPEAFSGAGAEETTEPAIRGKRRKPVTKETPSGMQVDLTRMEWPGEHILTRRVESLVETALNEERRRAEPEAETPKKRKAAKSETPVSKRKRGSPRQRTMLDYAV